MIRSCTNSYIEVINESFDKSEGNLLFMYCSITLKHNEDVRFYIKTLAKRSNQ